MATQANGFSVSSALGRKPALVFHTLRSSTGAILDERRGPFWGGESVLAGNLNISVSEQVSAALPPSVSLRFHRPEVTNGTKGSTAVAVYVDRDLSAVKALGFYRYGDPIADHLDLQGLFDGSVHAELRDGNDFWVMELGICRGLKSGANWYCCKSSDSTKCLGHWNLDL